MHTLDRLWSQLLFLTDLLIGGSKLLGPQTTGSILHAENELCLVFSPENL